MTSEIEKYEKDFLIAMNKSEPMTEGSNLMRFSCYLNQEAYRITSVLNSGFHDSKEIRKIFIQLIGKNVDKNFKLFPPFYTDCGKNIHLGKRVFINACCCFQDQGGIFIGDDVQIGHGVKIVTLNHGKEPNLRRNIYPSPVIIKNNVWIGSGAIILPGITIGENSIIGAGSVVTKNVPANVTVAGNPAKLIN